jgi:hypothetical protein
MIKIKKLLSICIIIFSLSLFANPVIDTTCLDTESEKVLDFDNEVEQDQEVDKEKKEFTLLNTFSLDTLCAWKEKSLYAIYQHSYHTNSSLYKPPIL